MSSKMFPVSHKTVFVLDHSAYFGQSCGEKMNYDACARLKTPGVIPAPHINKSLWTCSVECLFEYMRIVFDIYPVYKLIRVVVGDKCLNSWDQREMNMNSAGGSRVSPSDSSARDPSLVINKNLAVHDQLAVGFANMGPPGMTQGSADDEEFSVMHGLSQAVEALCQMTQHQEAYLAGSLQESIPLVNNGRIICFTHMKSESHVRSLENCVADAVRQHNKLAASKEGLMPINKLEMIFIHITPVKEISRIAERPMREITPEVNSQLHSTMSGTHLYQRMIHLVQRHYDLASTTVTGIPMKEEQNAQSSANYDVELLHSALVHSDQARITHTEPAGAAGSSGEGNDDIPATIILKWCTPKSSVVELHHCAGCFRITPVEINSRHSQCLTTFLLGGRAVMLEQPRKTGVKVLSHMLASHGGEIFIHILPTSRSILEDPPSISEGCGGRVTDYRITDFGDFMKRHKLVPFPPDKADELFASSDVRPCQKAFEALERSTRFFPIVIGETIIGNLMGSINPLPELIEQERLTDDQVLECKKVIYSIVSMETKNESLAVPAVGTRGKGPKKEEQYRQLWAELESLVRAYSDTSEQHAKVLECLLECKKPLPGEEAPSLAHLRSSSSTESKDIKEEKMDTGSADRGWKDYDKFQKMTERERQDLRKSDRVFTPPPAKKAYTEELLMKPAGQSLLSLWTCNVKDQHSKRHVEFAGRAENPGTIVAELYPHLKEEDMDTTRPMDIKPRPIKS